MSISKLAKQIKKEQKQADLPLGERFIQELDAYLIASRARIAEEREKSFSITPSGYYKCIRKQWYQLLRFPTKSRQYPRSIRILEVGTKLHEMVQEDIFMQDDFPIQLVDVKETVLSKVDGIEIVKEHDAPDMEVKVRDLRFTDKYPVSLMVDGLINFDNKDMIFEFKTINPDDYKVLFEPLTDHMKQGAVYSLVFGIPHVMFLYLNKGNQDWRAFSVEITDSQREWARNRIQEIEEYLIKMELPPKEPEPYCNLCKFKGHCDKDYAGEDFKEEDGFTVFEA